MSHSKDVVARFAVAVAGVALSAAFAGCSGGSGRRPGTNQIVWQYGHTGLRGRAPGYLSNPDGVDLAPPDSLLMTHAATMGRP